MAGPDLTGRRLGGFELGEQMGGGAFGTVWRARQLRLGRDVAVKILDPTVARNPDAARRFEREGRAAAALDHPAVVPVYEAGEDDGLVFLAMRLVEGETLADRLEREQVLDPATIMSLLTPVAHALDHAHEAGLVHRDVKPSNILLEAGRVWLADFGIAASTQEIGRYTLGALGTAEYMAPEQAAAGELDHRADLYSLGCVIHHCVTGAPPFAGDEPLPVLMAHANEPVPPSGDDSLDRFFDRALAKDPAERFATGADLIVALGEAVGTVTTGEPPTEPAARSRSPRRRWPLPAVAVASLAIVLAAVLVSLGGGSDGPASETLALDDTVDPAAGATADGDVAGGEAVDGAGATGPGDVSGADGDEATDGGADGSSSDPTAGPVLRAGGEVIVGSNALLEALNPHSDPNNEPYVSGHVLPTLIAVEGDFSLVPAVAAELPEVVSTDPFTVRWVLRDDATWDDGTPITWRDVDATWRYIVDPESAAVSTYLYDQITGLDPISDTEFTLSFAQPIGVFRVMFSTNHPLIKATAYQEHLDGGGSSADFLQDGLIPFSGGPYRTVGFEPGERVSLRRNDLYWGEPATLERVNIRRYDSIDDQIAAVGSGDIDVMWVELPAATEVIRARGLEGVTVTTGPSDFSFELHFNTRVAPLDEVAVRRAIAHAVDRQAIVDVLVQTATGEPAVPLQSLVHLPRQSAYSAPFAGYGDRASAERLLDEAGWTFSSPDDEVRTRDGVPLTLRLLYRDTTVDRLNGEGLAQILRDQLRRVGIDLELEGVGTSFTSLRAMGDFDLALDFNFVNSDPAAVGLRYATDACPPTVEGCDGEPVGANFDGYSNTEVDGLIAEAGSTQDAAARTALFVEIDGLLAGDVPALPLYEGPSFVAHIDDLVNVDLSASRGGPLARLDEWAYVALLD